MSYTSDKILIPTPPRYEISKRRREKISLG